MEEILDYGELINKLHLLNNEIMTGQKEDLERNAKKEDIQISLKNIEIKTLNEISEELDLDGKKKFSNELKRNIEQADRLQKDVLYKTYTSDLKRLQLEMDTFGIQIGYKLRLFKILLVVAKNATFSTKLNL